MGKEWDNFKPEFINDKMLKDKRPHTKIASQRRSNTAGTYDLSLKGNKKFQEWFTIFSIECLRVLKPGGHILSFGGTRTYHRMVCAIEDAGFEIRDTLQWIYGSGFPKSLDISKSIDKMKGAEREIGKLRTNGRGKWELKMDRKKGNTGIGHANGSKQLYHETIPSTPEAKQWEGWGTGLKPACEMICLARKPISEKNIAENILKWGTGGLNIDGCRIETDDKLGGGGEKYCNFQGKDGWDRPWMNDKIQQKRHANKIKQNVKHAESKGRFPSNVLLNEEAAGALDEQSGVLSSGAMKKAYKYTNSENSLGDPSGETKQIHESNIGTASRFFYVAKASRVERNAGLEGFEKKTKGSLNFRNPSASGRSEDAPSIEKMEGLTKPGQNPHPTVKPIKLMRYLVRLITPPKGICVDPFVGSGTTPIACIEEGFDYIGIEKEKEYFDIAEKRIFYYKRNLKLF